jgi:hypothetical protein
VCVCVCVCVRALTPNLESHEKTYRASAALTAISNAGQCAAVKAGAPCNKPMRDVSKFQGISIGS